MVNENKTLLIVDDDAALRQRLARAMERKGFAVTTAESVAQAAALAAVQDYALVDMRLADGYGLSVVEDLLQKNPAMRVVIMTAYGNIASAVKSVKLGAVDYLAKPIDADAAEAALLARDEALPPPPDNPMPADRVKWEHILRVFEQCERNVSETARKLNMHRRTLQRILAKHAPNEHPLDESDEA
jgi:two-component system response regulator RegA